MKDGPGGWCHPNPAQHSRTILPTNPHMHACLPPGFPFPFSSSCGGGLAHVPPQRTRMHAYMRPVLYTLHGLPFPLPLWYSHPQLPEFEQRVSVLQRLGYLAPDRSVTLKGRVCCEINSTQVRGGGCGGGGGRGTVGLLGLPLATSGCRVRPCGVAGLGREGFCKRDVPFGVACH